MLQGIAGTSVGRKALINMMDSQLRVNMAQARPSSAATSTVPL